MVHICAINNLTTIDEDVLSLFIPKLSQERREQVRKFQYTNDKKRCILSEILIRYMLKQYYDNDLKEVRFKRNRSGKLFLDNCDNIEFNVSHSGEWVVCCISDRPIGIDVEGGTENNLSIAKKYFHKEEYEYIISNDKELQNDLFYKIWTLKECYIKYLGEGFNIPINSFRFEFTDNKISLIDKGKRVKNVFFFNKKIDDTYNLSICSEYDNIDINAHILLEKELEKLKVEI